MEAQLKQARMGQMVAISTIKGIPEAFVPPLLPPTPAIQMDRLFQPLERAGLALGKLDGITSFLPDASLFISMYSQKEALLSSQIEGTQSSLSDLLQVTSKAEPVRASDDVQEVINYLIAMKHGLDRIRGDNGIPISLRLMREIHEKLLHKGRGSTKQPGEFRKFQNWIGTRPDNVRFVPPPPDRVLGLMANLEEFIHADTPKIPFLIKVGLVHAQFETIHPFLDGNGRLGRLLITLMFCAQNFLQEPILYLSLYLKAHRERYYDLLQKIRTQGDWESWLEFFLNGIAKTSQQATETANEIQELFKKDQARIQELGRSAASALRVHQILQQEPVITIPDAARKIGISNPTAARSVQHLERLGILREITNGQRSRIYLYDDYLEIISLGTEPLEL